MLPFPNLVFVTVFAVMGFGFSVAVLKISARGESLWGKPSINPLFFYAGKISMFIAWGFSLVKGIFPGFWLDVPLWMSWTGAGLLCAGTVVLLLSFYDLGASLKYGLPETDTKLKTTGVYRFTRHPLYMGVFLVTLASILFFPSIPTILAGVVCYTTHYAMILAEERFLAQRFGNDWKAYVKKVRRFI